MFKGDMLGESYRASHQSTDIVAEYISTFEVGYCAALWRKVEKPLLESILRPLGGRERTILDFACGTGRIARLAAVFFGSVVGVDVSEAMLLAALMRFLRGDVSSTTSARSVISAICLGLTAFDHYLAL